MNPYSIILAADLPDPDAVARLLEQVGPMVDGVKIGLATVLQAGLGFVKGIRDSAAGKPILLDLKIADIGHRGISGWEGTNAKIVRSLKDSGATHVTVHGFPGPVSLAEAAAAAHECGIQVLALPIMSHSGADLFFSQRLSRAELAAKAQAAAIDISTASLAEAAAIRDGIIALGEAIGVDGYIGPATNPKALAEIRTMTSKPIWCPGFGRQDRLGRDLETQFRDWARAVGTQSAAIVGSLIFGAPDPLAQAERIRETRDRVVASLASS
uniref:Orotidine 5'-phosphate decarboxylase n=1 Tax=Desulfomonile tiedjei TaxID=2358 RepID=A0A7C4EVV5_9BACT